MGRNTSIYMFNKEKAAAHLYEDLQHRTYHAGTFKKFIEDRNKEFSDYHYNISFDTILETVKNDINMITPDELFVLTLFFDEEVYPQFYNAPLSERDQYFEKLYDHSGITLLYEIPTSTVCYSYMFQYANYTHYFPLDEIKSDDGGTNILSEDFLRFNDYIILLMKRILENKLDGYDYQLTEEEEQIIDTIKTENQSNPVLFEVIEEELQFITETSATDHKGPYSQTICYAYDFLNKAIEMKLKIDIEKNSRIVIVDSY
ncbi:hypothetical protein EGY05_16895 [Chryseobacterium arthrosphaerae]|uniref:hypothetical protein n=1 Tax=Chryseobacterium arthrosphaerae TaxID=651561 RepID=UPI000F517276|nr:hypothetical protein [Chryseobacterium arthrosphaerae]AYZ13511.1 hypothetical protein EGY05_16895 [Chryseobacterium arthrosphaerae]